MRIERITDLDEGLTKQIITVWEAAVKQTHIFLTDEDIEVYKAFVLKTLPDIELLFCAYDDNDFLTAFIGINGEKVELLFVDPDSRARGIGKSLLELAIEKFGAKTVDVNEQNQQAVGFYEHLRFRTVDRAPNDNKGKPYPLLTMQHFPARSNSVVSTPVKKEVAPEFVAEFSEENTANQQPEKKKTSLSFMIINTFLILAVLTLVLFLVFPAVAADVVAYVQNIINPQ